MRVQTEFVLVQNLLITDQWRPTPTFILQVPVLDQVLLLLHSVLSSFTDTTKFRFELDRFAILARPIRLRV